MKLLALFIFSLSLSLITGCGGNSTSSDTQGDARFKVTFSTNWSVANFPTQYPSSAHFSPLVGSVHNDQVIFWRPNDQPATAGIKSMAETGSTAIFSNEITRAQDSGYSQGVIQANGISGVDQTTLTFDTTASHPLLTLVSMIAPSPDWFVGIHGVSLIKSDGQWIERKEIKLKAYDSGTDTGVSFTSNNSDSTSQNLPIVLLNSNRTDSDFSAGIHFQTSKTIGTITIEQIRP